jgi:hypothetical protein
VTSACRGPARTGGDLARSLRPDAARVQTGYLSCPLTRRVRQRIACLAVVGADGGNDPTSPGERPSPCCEIDAALMPLAHLG